ncbi:MAG TPA: hypothetical protein VFD05_00330 [Bacilli bacterium]|nr:hypothetical protein [Bacilli bacterium]
MKSKFSKQLIFVLFGVLLITSCDNGKTSAPDTSNPSTVIPSSEVISSTSEKEIYDGPVDQFSRVEPGTNYSNRALDHAIEMTALDSLGEQKLLVVPVVFSNTAGTHDTEENHEMLERVFFGESEDTGWESLASYYAKSSYGRLTLTGEVADYFYLDYSTFELAEKHVDDAQYIGEDHYWDETHHVIKDIYNTYDAEYLKQFDLDGDGFVDAFWMVYMAEIGAVGDDSDVFWAYKFYWNRLPNKDKPTPNTYAWAGFTFARDGKGYSYAEPDAHTFIHETGHLLSLPDYYDYDTDSRTGMQLTNPSGGLDMMAYNIADHNSYSKYRYNWIEPYVVEGNADITIAPFESSGDAILLKNGWNGHAYDEYLMFDFYTPTGLNEKDSEEGGYSSKRNPNSGTRNFTIPGVRIWHVDSRLLKYVYDHTGEFVSRTWTNTISGDAYHYTAVGPSNTASRSRAQKIGTETEIADDLKLLHLLNAEGRTGKVGNWLRTGTVAGNKALFQEGDVIEYDNWKQYLQNSEAFNDGTPVGYTVEIGEMTEEGVTIKFRVAN